MLVKQESLRNYFHDFLQKSLHKQNIEAQDHTVSYITNLLISFTSTENFIDQGQGRAAHKPLALYYSDAMNSHSNHERVIALRRLGDIALFICGLFSESLNNKAIDVDYYVSMGGSAYGYLSESNLTASNSSCYNDVFNELSRKFVDFADILSDLNESQSNKNLLRTYEVWIRTQSKKARNILIENNILPIEQNFILQ